MSSLRLILLSLLLASCAPGTIAQLKNAKLDLKDEQIEGGLDKAIQGYQTYLEKAPESEKTPESMLRLADLKIQKEFDFSESAEVLAGNAASSGKPESSASGTESFTDFEKRTTTGNQTSSSTAGKRMPGAAAAELQTPGTREAISLYRKVLNDYPKYEFNDHALYRLARVYEELGDAEEAVRMMDRMAKGYPHSRYIDEVQFRRGEYYYVSRKYPEAQEAYKAIVVFGVKSPYYELALYKLGWTYYKQEQYELAMNQFVALLDHKVAAGYNPDRPLDAVDEKRIEDTYRVMSLSFSYLGGADAVGEYFERFGKRPYEASAYKNLGDYFLEKRRYTDAAVTFKSFVGRNTGHRSAPLFYLWAIESYKKGGFSRLVIETDREFAINYGVKSAYWTHFDAAAFNEMSGNLKSILKELANYFHAQYRDKGLAKSKDDNFSEALKWYREYLDSFPKDENAPFIHFQMSELLLENKWYGKASIEYEHVAYAYPPHEKSAAAGYSAVYALRENMASVAKVDEDRLRRDIIRSSLKFSDTFPKHEKAALVLSAAVDDIYGMKDYAPAAVNAKKMLARYPGTEHSLRRATWLVFAHSSFEIGAYKDAEEGYISALGLTAKDDSSRAGLVENLAASFYKQGEQASKLGDYRKAASYFLLVGSEAPSSKIRPVADYESVVAFIQIKDWDAAVNTANSFRKKYPGHQLQPEITKKLAIAYKEAGKLALAAVEYERVAAEAQDLSIRREALATAGDMYYQAKELGKAYPIYLRYVKEFPRPLEYALEIRYKIALYLKTRANLNEYLGELRTIMELDADAGSERTSRTRYLGATAALEFAELTIKEFVEIKIAKPFDKNLVNKKEAMKTAKGELEKLFGYEMDELTAAATFYLAEMYYDFSRKLIESERPGDLSALEKEQYELSIEEQAYPFEEKTIEVHKKNMELMTLGIYNTWIEKSIEKLAKLVPARFAKYEESSGFIDTFDNVSYLPLIAPKPVSSKPAQVLRPAENVPATSK